jgi:hypothetical protein
MTERIDRQESYKYRHPPELYFPPTNLINILSNFPDVFWRSHSNWFLATKWKISDISCQINDALEVDTCIRY